MLRSDFHTFLQKKKMVAQRAWCRHVKDMFYSFSPERNWLKWTQFAIAVWDQQVWMGTTNKSEDLCILQIQPIPLGLLLVCLSSVGILSFKMCAVTFLNHNNNFAALSCLGRISHKMRNHK